MGKSLSLSELKKAETVEDGVYKLSQFVNEDLIFLKKPEEATDFVVIGGVWAAPTRVSMGSSLGESIISIHSEVSTDPEKVARFSAMINNSLSWLFTNPKSIVRRNNFFLEEDPTYSMPNGFRWTYTGPEEINRGNYKAYTFVRIERQTLRGLPRSQVVVFSILPMVYSIGQVMTDSAIAQNVLKGLTLKFAGDEPDEVTKQLIQYMTEELKIPVSK